MNSFVTVLNERSKHIPFLILIATLIFIATYSYIGVVIRPGLDPSYQFAFNYFFANNIQIGKDILFSFGPLGFLLWPQPIGDNIFLGHLVDGLFKLLFIFFALYLNSITKPKTELFAFFTIIFLTFFIALQINIHNLVIFLSVVLLMLHRIKGNVFFLMFASSFVAVGLAIKASSGIICSLILFSYLCITYIADKKITKIPISLLTLCITFLLIWFLMYQNFSGIINYFIATLELSQGNSSAMTLNPNNNWWLFIFFLFSFLMIPFALKDKNIFFLYFIMILSIAACFKYAISRADHIGHFLIYLMQFLYIVLIVSKDIQKKHLVLLSITFLLFCSFIFATPYNKRAFAGFCRPIYNNILNKPVISKRLINRAKHLAAVALCSDTVEAGVYNLRSSQLPAVSFITYNTHYQNLVKKSGKLLESQKLEPEVMSIIQNNTIDMYPWELSYIASNDLNWTPRPVIQSYVSYTPYLDMKNADFFNSIRSPQFILWEKKHWGEEVGSIDGRYLFNDEPLTLFQILNHYQSVYENTSFLLLKRTEYELLEYPIIIYANDYQWNTWIPIPEGISSGNNILRAKVNIERTLIQKVKKLLYNEFEVYITYQFLNGEKKKYRIVVDNAKNGLWINPFQKNLLKYSTENNVVSLKLTHSKGDYFENPINIEWEVIKMQNSIFKTIEDKH